MSSYDPKKMISTNLALIIELDYAVPRAVDEYQQALKAVIEYTNLHKFDHVKVNIHYIDNLTKFDDIHEKPHPIEFLTTHPVVIEYFYCLESKKCFIKCQINLCYYDGLSVTHTSLCILEYLEHSDHGSIPPYQYMTKPSRFKQHNSPSDISTFTLIINFITILLTLIFYFFKGLIEKYLYRSTSVAVGPMIYFNENNPRYYMRYSNIKTPFSKLLDIMQELKTKLKLPTISYTINFSPNVSIGFLPDFKSMKSQQKRIGGMSVPIGHPAPMDAMHVALVSTSIFYNNYGRFDPNISGNAVGFLWNWIGLEPNFCGFIIVCSIKQKLFACVGLPHVHTTNDDVMKTLTQIEAVDGVLPVKNQPFASILPAINKSNRIKND
jgi:hypothetical protein